MQRMECVRTLTPCTYYGLISRIVCTHGLALLRWLCTLLGLLPQGLPPLQAASGRPDDFAQEDSRRCGAQADSGLRRLKEDRGAAPHDIAVFVGKSSQLPLQRLPDSGWSAR